MAQEPRLRLDPSAVQSAITRIRALDLRIASIEEIVDLLFPLFRGYTTEAPRFHSGMDLFRARLCDKPVYFSELSYAPARLTRLGRVNRPGNPVLYCSTSRQTPFFESRPEMGQTIVIVQWKTTTRLMVNHVGYTRTAFEKLSSNRKNAGWSNAPAAVFGNKTNRVVFEFLAEAFTRPVPKGSEHLYKLSVAIAEKLFSDDLFDALLYPTVQMRANADNLAVKPRYADKHLRFVKAEFACINHVRDFGFDIDVLDTASELAPGGKILGKGHTDRWTLRNRDNELFASVEEGRWVARQ